MKRAESARELFLGTSPSWVLGVVVVLWVGLHGLAAVVLLAGWARHPEFILALGAGLLFFLAALGLWRLLAWARRLTVGVLWLVVVGVPLLAARALLVPGAGPSGPAAAGAVLGLAALAVASAAGCLRVLRRHRARFHERLL